MTSNRAAFWSTRVLACVAAVGALGAPALGQSKDNPQKQPDVKGTEKPKVEPAKPAAEKPSDKQPADKKAEPGAAKEAAVNPYVLDFKVKALDGKEQSLEQYKGKVIVIVNVASQCGFTSQYEGLEKLYEENKDKGLVVLGFPADNFGHQEPGGSSQIQEFCSSKFHVTFPMFEKISVVSSKTAEEAKAKKRPVFADGEQHPLYQRLSAQPAPIGGDPKWNFTKFVVDREGKVVARFDAARENATKATLEEGLLKKVDELLKAK
jgi:glutathione peroxidase